MPHLSALSRRQFLTTSAAAVGAFSLGRGMAAEESPYGSFRVGAQSYSFREFGLEEALKQYQLLGLKWGEFSNKHITPRASQDDIDAMKKLCREYGVRPVAFGVQKFTKDHDANRKLFDFGKMLGIQYFSADPDPDSFDSLDKLCEEYKIAVGIHPHGPVGGGEKLHRWYSAEVMLPAVKDHHPLIGACIDTGHILRCSLVGQNLDPAEQIRAMGKRNFGLHFKDFDPQLKTEVIVGQGALNIPDVLKALKEVHFPGSISLEYELNPKNPVPDMAVGLKAVSKAAMSVG